VRIWVPRTSHHEIAKYGRDGQFLDYIHTDKEMIRK
jgi:hypothetical protein